MVAAHSLVHVFWSAVIWVRVLLGLPEAFVGLYSYAGSGKQESKCGRQKSRISPLMVQVS